MSVIVLTSILSSDWLRYGFIGLVAVINMVAFFAIRPLIKQQPKQTLWPILFLLFSLVLLAGGGFSTYTSDKMKFDNKRDVDSVKIENQALNKKLEVYTDTSPEAEALRQKITANKKSLDSLDNINQQLSKDLSNRKELISELVMKSIVEALEEDLIATGGKRRLNITDINFKRLRQAVFLNFESFDADPSILRQALDMYRKQNGEFSEKDIDRMIKDLPNLMRIRLRWLKTVAIPAVEEKIRMLERNPQMQEGTSVDVPIPDEAIILRVSDENGGNRVTVDNVTGLKKERDLLVARLNAL